MSSNIEKQNEVQTVYKKFALEDNEHGEWISRDWLKKWLESGVDKFVSEIDNKNAFCQHKK